MDSDARVRRLLTRPGLFAITWWGSVLGGWAVVAWSVAQLSGGQIEVMGPPLVMIAALVLLGELRPFVTSSSGNIPVPFSTAFVFAALYLWGLAPAAVLMAFGVTLSELLQHKPGWKLLFNVGQYVLSVAAGWLVMVVAGVAPTPAEPITGLSGGDLLWLVGSWLAYHLVNLALVAGLAGSEHRTFWDDFAEDFWFYTFSTLAVLAVSPLIAVVAHADPGSWLLLPLLVLPLLAVYMTARMSREKEHQSLHDSLTGLPNRTLLARRFTTALADREDAQGGCVGLCLLDLDRFKEVNDTLGHQVGDELLVLVARRITASVRPADTVARLGGDEFAVLLPGVRVPEHALEIAERIRSALVEPVHLDGVLVDVAVSIGLALAQRTTPDDLGDDFDTVLRRADVAMYVAKADGTGVELYDAARDPHSPQRLGTAAALRSALSDGLIDVHYQPKVSLGDGSVAGFEALARWTHPDRGPVPPEEFIPLAERTGLVHLLTQQVLDRALAQAGQWWRHGHRIPVAVNVSMRDLQDSDVPRLVGDGLRRHRLPPEAVVLEVTESVFVQDATRAVACLRHLAAAGVRSSLDDFGTGYSSLVLLEQLPVSEVKVDREFVRRLDEAGDDGVVRAVIGMAHGLGLSVVAEGVESATSYDRLAELGCDAVQGWHVARAMPGQEATEWLTSRSARRGQRSPLRVVGGPDLG